MLSRFFYIPFVIGVAAFLIVGFTIDSNYFIYIVPFVVCIAVVYILSPQIDWWWHQRHPPELPAGVRHLINTQSLFYQNLSADDKTRFRNRMAMYMEANEFMGQGMEVVPPDIRGVVAASVVQITFGYENYLLNKFEHIIIYPHRFPSPQHPEELHASEYYEEDGAIIFSAEQLMPGFMQPQRFLNIGLYEYTRVFRNCHPEVDFPYIGVEHWPALVEISGFLQDKTIQYIGLPEIDLVALAVVYYYDFGERFKVVLPGEYEGIGRALWVDG
ncbi:MAG: hypothetical protein GC192_24410 [Bacteroidetes bacterium]|nr:hypothetical protein [Bacteroidota bacterium]